MLENKKILAKNSNIETLNSILLELKDSMKNSIVQTKRDRLNRLYDNLMNKLNSKVQTNKLEISQSKRELRKLEDGFNSDIRNIESTILNMHKQLKEL